MTVSEDLMSRESPEVVKLDSLHDCPRSLYIGKFPQEGDFDRVINDDCDVYVAEAKVLSFRRSLIPALSEGSSGEAWPFFRRASREVYGTQRGVVAGTELTTRREARLTRGQVDFFKGAISGSISNLESARQVLSSSDELTVKTLKSKHIKKEFPHIKNALAEIDKRAKSGAFVGEEEKRTVLWSWFEPWLEEVWSKSLSKKEEASKVHSNFISSQLNFNHCYSNVLGAIDRGARFPYGRLSGTTQRNFEDFEKFKSVYIAVDQGFKSLFPETWSKVRSVISKVKEPLYSLFDTAFTSITLNFNFQTAYHVDKNNLKEAMAVLTVISQGSYTGHYLVFPELKLAFDVRDGDFIIADTQNLIHGNTPMVKNSEDAERVSMVFYSRENMVYLDDLECETCRRDFIRHSSQNLREKGKEHSDWRGVWPQMWLSDEWKAFKAERGLTRCSNSNWQLSSPYKNTVTGEVKLHKFAPSPEWVLYD